MAKIIKLDDALANKIAAGEVVERPASIVKELVENSLDAGSTHILIEIEEGGLSSLRIVDNGEGIPEADVETAFLRHATSKIKTDRDLFQIKSLGFRGEALPSIASVSHLTLQTSTGEGAGVELRLEGGVIKHKKAAPARKGTDITVTNLFYNTPARLKYVKTVHTEAGNISDIVNRLALAHPDVAFECYHNQKEMLKTAGNGDLKQVLAAIYGRNVARSMRPFSRESLDYTIEGYAGLPELTRASRQYMSIFVNGRFIRNYSLARAIQDGYHTLLPIGRFPIAVVAISMDPQLIDVNVHPAKLEVRLSKEEELGELLTKTIRALWQKEQLIPAADLNRRSEVTPSKKQSQTEQLPIQLDYSQAEAPRQVQQAQKNDEAPAPERQQAETVRETPDPAPLFFSEEEKLETAAEQQETVDVNGGTEQEAPVETPSAPPQQANSGIEEAVSPEAQERVPVLYPVGQMHGTYIIAQNETGMYLIDQHAAQERIKYEYYRDKVGDITPQVQELLLPITLECTAQEKEILTEQKEALAEVGVFLEVFGTQAFIIRSYPTWLPKGAEEETIREIIDYMLTHRKVDIAKLREEAAIMMSCKAAIKANRHLRQDEMFALLEALRACQDPFTCPHGRPIIVHFSTYALEKMFKRVM
ncbi:DNA mismatch repair endonuclease MutL [Alkalihalobacillus oceani]|uniref:DNA mismatch repair endonuclease MutL n=1 Tax=Halalkalibacter oceani TaxID=1653776 RepID=UPI00203D59D4|nr:DNA mismatch repair endonuclease MutL [Halalkalibacter oceani]MCM3761343.1 DNA mismatch repair endonuclease MutL [Halalkalibacter oceani]